MEALPAERAAGRPGRDVPHPGGRAPGGGARWHRTCNLSVQPQRLARRRRRRERRDLPPQVATPVVPYGCRRDLLRQACARRSRPARSCQSQTRMRRMASREDTHMEQTTHALPAHPRADVRAILKARLADSIDLMPHAKSAHGHVKGPSATWRSFPATAAIAGVFGLVLLAPLGDAQTVPAAGAEAPISSLLPTKLRAAAEDDANRPLRTETTIPHKETIITQRDTLPSTATPAVRPFHIRVPEEALVALRQRLTATRWPDQETVTDRSLGVQLAKIQALVRYWGTDYDWRKAEAKLNTLPQFVTNIDGLDIHFIHIRSRHPHALPLLKTIGPLTDPTAYGGRAEDAFDLVLPLMPCGFSEKPQGTGWSLDRIARAWDVLMQRLGYPRYVSQGGDWGAIISDVMGRQAPPGLLGIHLNRFDRSSTIPLDVARALTNGEPAPAHLTAEERAAFDQTREFHKQGLGYAAMMGTRQQTIGYSLADSPVGLAAWCYDKFTAWVFTRGEPERSLTRDEMLDDCTLYWLTNTGTSGARLYWENNTHSTAVNVSIPTALTVFPGEIYQLQRSWAERAYHTLIYYHRSSWQAVLSQDRVS